MERMIVAEGCKSIIGRARSKIGLSDLKLNTIDIYLCTAEGCCLDDELDY